MRARVEKVDVLGWNKSLTGRGGGASGEWGRGGGGGNGVVGQGIPVPLPPLLTRRFGWRRARKRSKGEEEPPP